MSSVLSKLSKYTYFYGSKSITSYTFLLAFKIVESLQCILKINESRYIALFMVDGSIKKRFSTDYVNIYLFSIFVSIDFAQWKSVGLPHIDYIVIH